MRKTINIKTFSESEDEHERGEKFTEILGAQNFSSFLEFFGMREVLFLLIHDMEGEFLEKYSRGLREKKIGSLYGA